MLRSWTPSWTRSKRTSRRSASSAARAALAAGARRAPGRAGAPGARSPRHGRAHPRAEACRSRRSPRDLRAGGLELLAVEVVERTHAAPGVAGDDRIADVERAAVDEHRRDGADRRRAVTRRSARGIGLGVRLELELGVGDASSTFSRGRRGSASRVPRPRRTASCHPTLRAGQDPRRRARSCRGSRRAGRPCSRRRRSAPPPRERARSTPSSAA